MPRQRSTPERCGGSLISDQIFLQAQGAAAQD
jgi:hypothetical protein